MRAILETAPLLNLHFLELFWSSFFIVRRKTTETTTPVIDLLKLVKAENSASLKEISATGERTRGAIKSAKQAQPRYDMYFEVANLRLGRSAEEPLEQGISDDPTTASTFE